jgi:phosphopantothenoylcysteine synthetase/decarboxylase
MVARRFVVKILVTAGNTQALIDRVRCLTNIFTGQTGASIAWHAHTRGHDVTILTSRPETVKDRRAITWPTERWSLEVYRTFEDLQDLLSDLVRAGDFDALVHSAAVSDYLVAGVYSPADHTKFHADGRWTSDRDGPALVDRAAGKVKSDEPELWIRLLRAPKLIDRVRSDWNFRGVLVKFKLEVGIGDDRLLEIAERSRRHSNADLMVANTLEGADSWAFLGPVRDDYERVERPALPSRLLDEIERLHEERRRG